ncbi:MAG: helix-turn-helix transcriptional regulator [Phycisphaerae bacterium]
MSDIDEQLREAARNSGLSIKAMSDRAGIPYAAVHGFVRSDGRTMTLRTAAKLAVLLGLELRPVRRRKARPKG